MPTLYAIPFRENENDIYTQMDSLALYANLSPEEKRIYDYELKMKWDEAARLESAEEAGLARGLEKGLEQGREQGRAEGRLEGLEQGRKEEARHIAENLKKSGLDTELIKKATGLSQEEIEAL